MGNRNKRLGIGNVDRMALDRIPIPRVKLIDTANTMTAALTTGPDTGERPSTKLPPVVETGQAVGLPEGFIAWECGEHYYGSVQRHAAGFYFGNGPWAVIGITACDETARHDWRDFQHVKNGLVGEEWEAVELYPSESRLRDPSNRFYLWCVPPGVFRFGFVAGRSVMNVGQGEAPQRPFPT